MTLLMVFDALDQGKLRLTDMLPISRHAAAQRPCKLGLRAGSYISVKDLILACVTKSANDAAVVLGEFLGGSEAAFAEYMTQRARQFGMKHTTFKTASGWPAAGQLTTAKDMALLGIITNKHYRKYFHLFSTREFCYNNACHINHHYRLLAQKHLKFDGIKTGFVNASGFNVIGTYTNEAGKRIVIVVMGGPTPAWRDKRAVEIAQRFKTIRPQTYIAQSASPNVQPKPMLLAQTIPSKTTMAETQDENPDDDSPPVQEIAPASTESGNYSLLLGYYGSQLRAETVAKQALLQSKLGVDKPISTKRIRIGGRYLYQASIDKLSKKQVDQASAVLRRFNIDSSTVEQPS
jgi:D-alanyl-D-alanine carboxypeptidase